MRTTLLKAIVILPGTVLVVVPALIVWFTRDTLFSARLASPLEWYFWIGIAAAATGLPLMVWTTRDFMRIGEGTPAPWQPPKRLVVHGPYRHVRNPMISGVLLALLAESVLLRSIPTAVWMLVFVAANAIYIPLIEEPGLERRFGEDYRRYKANVPRWVPRFSPWQGPDDA